MTAGMDALAEAMRFEQARIYGRTLPDACSHRDEVPVRSLESTRGPAAPEVIAELVDALTLHAVSGRVDRAGIEQAIARGLDDDAIVLQLRAPLADVQHVRDELERLSA